VDCKVLENIFRDPTVAKFIDDHFHVVRIDLGVYFVLLDNHGVVVQPTETADGERRGSSLPLR
jgi:hypothetical protein